MSEHVAVKSVSGGKPWQDLVFYDIVFERNGADFPASWGRKGEGIPQPGEQLEGEFYQDKKQQWRFKKASKPAGMFSAKGDAMFTSHGREWQPETQRDPERSARILRQHSQSAAIQILTGTGSFTDPHATPERIQRWLTEWADWFDQDVIQAAKQGADKSEGATPLVSPSPASRTAPGTSAQAVDARPGPERNDEAQYLDHCLDDMGVIDYDDRRWLVSAWEALEKKKKEPAYKQLTNVGDPEHQQAGLKRLWELAGPVPEYFRDKDDEAIPF